MARFGEKSHSGSSSTFNHNNMVSMSRLHERRHHGFVHSRRLQGEGGFLEGPLRTQQTGMRESVLSAKLCIEEIEYSATYHHRSSCHPTQASTSCCAQKIVSGRQSVIRLSVNLWPYPLSTPERPCRIARRPKYIIAKYETKRAQETGQARAPEEDSYLDLFQRLCGSRVLLAQDMAYIYSGCRLQTALSLI